MLKRAQIFGDRLAAIGYPIVAHDLREARKPMKTRVFSVGTVRLELKKNYFLCTNPQLLSRRRHSSIGQARTMARWRDAPSAVRQSKEEGLPLAPTGIPSCRPGGGRPCRCDRIPGPGDRPPG